MSATLTRKQVTRKQKRGDCGVMNNMKELRILAETLSILTQELPL